MADEDVKIIIKQKGTIPVYTKTKVGTGEIYHDESLEGKGTVADPLKVSEEIIVDIDSRVEKTSEADKVYGTDSEGNQTVYDKGSFGQVDDVLVNGTSVVTNKIAEVEVPTAVSELTNDANYQNGTQVSNTVSGAINTHNTSNDAHSNLLTPITQDIDAIEEKIPAQASAENKLADKNFVNSSVATNTAYFIGTFNSVEELEAYSGTLTNNDYAFVVSTDEAGNTVYDRYKYNTDTQQWIFEYELNNSSFTADQWAAINSGATSEAIAQISTNTGTISEHIADTSNPHEVTKAQVGLGNVDNTSDLDKPISTATQTALNAKQDKLTAGSGINIDPNTNVISSTTAESNFRGRFVNYASVPTSSGGYTPDYRGIRTPSNNDYMVVSDASDYAPTTSFVSDGTYINYNIDGYKGTLKITDIPVYRIHIGEFNQFDIRCEQGARLYIYCNLANTYKTSPSATTYITTDSACINVDPRSRWSESFYRDSGSYQGAWRFRYIGMWSTDGKSGWLPEYQIEDTLPIATDAEPGIAKLYNTTGQNTDGSMTQKSITDALNTKVSDVLVNGVSVVSNKVATINTIKSDWAQTDSTQPDYILHKPTNVSDFTNDANYQNAQEVGSSITTAISEHNTASDAHSNILTPIKADITDIQALIPSAATTSNQLADKEFVNSTVATQTANFIGTFANVSELRAYSGAITNNDYAFVINQVVTDNGNDWATFAALDLYDKNLLTDYDYAWVIDGTKFDLYRFDIVEQEWSLKADNIDKDDVSLNRAFCRYKATVSGATVTWNYEYTLNNSSFTAAQWAAINSGVTPAMVADYLDPNSTSSSAYNTRISTLTLNKLSKTSTASRVYGTDSAGAQTLYQAGDNIEFGTDGKINVTGVQQQMFEMPEATADLLGSIVQYLGDTDQDYTHGVMYQCVPVYGNYTATYSGTGTITNVQLDAETFVNSTEYREGQTSYVFTCTRGGIRQTWRTPSGRTTSMGLSLYGITYSGRPSVDDTITVTASIVGYRWEAYAGVSAGNDKIQVIGEKIYGVNVVPQYTSNTLPTATENNAGMICQYRGSGTLHDIYQDGYFYQATENTRMRDFSLEADPNKYSSLYISDVMTLEDFMENEFDDVTFYWTSTMSGTGWVMRDSAIEIPTADLSQYGISYTLEDGQTLSNGDEITVHIIKSYYWKNIQVQPDNFIVDVLPNASIDNRERVVFLAGSDMIAPSPEYPVGKWYRCKLLYNEEDDEYYYDWVLLPNQIDLPMVTEMETDATKVTTGQCFDYVGDDSVEYSNDLQRIVLRKGHIYRAVVKYPDDPDFATVCYYDAYPYQFDAMPTGEEEYNEVVAQYTGTDVSTYVQGHFYRCVPTGEMTPPSSMSKPSEEGFSFEIDADVLETQVQDPTQAFTFEFKSQGPGFSWVVKTGPNQWTSCELSDYGITVVGEAPYGAQVKVKYIEPQPEYIWQEIPVGGATVVYDPINESLTIS